MAYFYIEPFALESENREGGTMENTEAKDVSDVGY
jgi:hypothetical protein